MTQKQNDWRDGALKEYGRDMKGMQNQLQECRKLNAELVKTMEEVEETLRTLPRQELSQTTIACVTHLQAALALAKAAATPKE